MTAAQGPDDARIRVEAAAEARCPLVIDVDHALVRASIPLEALIVIAKSQPLAALGAIGRLVAGAGGLERVLADRARIDGDTLPVDERVVALARAAAESGRPVHLCSARDERLADDLRRRFPFVSGAVCGTVAVPLEGAEKARALAARFPLGFDYVGGSGADVPVWQRCRQAFLIGVPAATAREVAAKAASVEVLPTLAWHGPLVRAFRLQQWVKNTLVLAPLVLGGKVADPAALTATFAMLLAMGLVASATYIVNDALDLQDDRRHWSKRHRPLASGALPLGKGLSAAALLLIAGLGIAAAIGTGALTAIGGYIALTLAYSLALKRVAIVDVLTLAVLYTLRLVIGIAAAGVPTSPWLLAFSMLLFMSLSLAKRYGELQRAVGKGLERLQGRAYRREDLPFLLALGISAGVSAVVVIVLYILEDAFRQSFYGWTAWLWGFPPLMFLLVARTWLIAVRGELSDDPIDSAIRDRTSQVALLLLLVCFALAWLG